MTYDASDPKQVKEKAKLAKSGDQDKANFITTIMASREGRLWVRDLLEAGHIFQSSFSTDALRTAFLEGERNIGLKVLADVMAACPDRYIEMMKEIKE